MLILKMHAILRSGTINLVARRRFLVAAITSDRKITCPTGSGKEIEME